MQRPTSTELKYQQFKLASILLKQSAQRSDEISVHKFQCVDMSTTFILMLIQYKRENLNRALMHDWIRSITVPITMTSYTEVKKGETGMTKRNDDAKTMDTCALNLNLIINPANANTQPAFISVFTKFVSNPWRDLRNPG
jgi:hypothetical protein